MESTFTKIADVPSRAGEITEVTEVTELPGVPGVTDRFAFGKNWQSFLRLLDADRVALAESSLRSMLETDSLAGRSFLDVGSGSGLFSLAAMRLGARRVHSFDFDADSVACAQNVKRHFFPDAVEWTIQRGSVLDRDYLGRLGRFDVVYAWGVLHHTGNMWQALENILPVVERNGTLFIAIYNEQGYLSRMWSSVKMLYNRSAIWRSVFPCIFIPAFVARAALSDLYRRQLPWRRYLRRTKKDRGMSVVHDWLDWLGGYPFEVAKPEAIFQHCRSRGFTLQKLTTCGGGHGNNEYVFVRGLET
jgi:2-polyprenyl-6-hydroxyphenyl methylase/3-demethylubiquinone-9 3-methyltransferase